MHAFLTNPAYAGAFVFGRTSQKKSLDETGRVRRRTVDLPLERWSVCLPEHHPGYVSWDEYLATRERLRANVRPRGEGGGAAREGVALLQGIVRCGRCGRRMQVAYVRELENILERGFSLAADALKISAKDLHLTPPADETDTPMPAGDKWPLQDYLDRVERVAINEALEKTRYNRTAAAKLLGITFRAMRYRMERLGIK